MINPCQLKDEAYYQAMHAKETVENAEIYNTLEEFVKDKNIDFIVGSTGMPGGSYNISRIPIKEYLLIASGKISFVYLKSLIYVLKIIKRSFSITLSPHKL